MEDPFCLHTSSSLGIMVVGSLLFCHLFLYILYFGGRCGWGSIPLASLLLYKLICGGKNGLGCTPSLTPSELLSKLPLNCFQRHTYPIGLNCVHRQIHTDIYNAIHSMALYEPMSQEILSSFQDSFHKYQIVDGMACPPS